MALYGPPNAASAFDNSLDVGSTDAVIFIFEFSTWLDNLDALRLVGRVPRRRRVVIDCDGKYNDAISVAGDVNHKDTAASRQWVEVCDSLSDKVYQPTYHPLRPNVGTFFFHAYNPAWEAPLNFRTKEYGMVYVGNNWFRWRALQRVLRAVEPIRERIGRVGLVGNGWEEPPVRRDPRLPDDAYYTDPAYLHKLDVEVCAPRSLRPGDRQDGPRPLQPGDLPAVVRPPAIGDLPHVRDPGSQHNPPVWAGCGLGRRGPWRRGPRTGAAGRAARGENPGPAAGPSTTQRSSGASVGGSPRSIPTPHYSGS